MTISEPSFISVVPMIPPIIIELLQKTEALLKVVLSRDFEFVHRFIRSLYDSGVLSAEAYDELSLELGDLIVAEDDFEEKARKFVKKIEKLMLHHSSSSKLLNAILRRNFEFVHRFIRSLYDSGVLSAEAYDELSLELGDLIVAEDDFEEKARKFVKKIEAVINDK